MRSLSHRWWLKLLEFIQTNTLKTLFTWNKRMSQSAVTHRMLRNSIPRKNIGCSQSNEISPHFWQFWLFRLKSRILPENTPFRSKILKVHSFVILKIIVATKKPEQPISPTAKFNGNTYFFLPFSRPAPRNCQIWIQTKGRSVIFISFPTNVPKFRRLTVEGKLRTNLRNLSTK